MISKVTSRGQTTIPREVRKALGLKASDKILYILEGKQAIIKPLKGNILSLKGSFPVSGAIDFKETREKVKKLVGEKIAGELRNE